MIRMATDVGQAYCGWSHEELPNRDDSQDVSIAQMLDHGSISFGRFAVESLSWEKRSVFTYNKCQEELEKFKAPGLVAQKKAFFEEHYRKLRAQKALQENHQTELTLDYGGDGSISSQTGEEDEPTLQHGNLGDGEANVTDDLSEDINVTIEEKMNCNEALEIRSLDSELLNIDSSRRSIEKVDQEKKSNNVRGLHHSDTEFMGQRLSTKSIESVEQNDLSNVENKNTSKIEEGAASNIGPEVAYQEYAIGSKIARVGDLKLRPAKNIIQDKTRHTIKKSREARMSVPKPKEAIASVRNDLKLDARMMLDLVKSPNGGKALQKSSGKVESSITLGKPTSNRVAGSKILATSASNRPLTEGKPTASRVAKKISALNASNRQLTQVRPNVTIPRPFSFATERRAAVPAGIRETTQKMESKASCRLEHSLVVAKSGSHAQVNLKKTTITSSANGRGLKNRVHEELRKRPLEVESKCTGVRGSAAHVAHMLGTRKSRSIDLPPQNKSYRNAGIEKQLSSNIKGEKGKEGKGDARLKEPQCVRTKATTIPMDRNVHTGTDKTVEPAFSMRRPQTADLLLDGRKRRGEMPRWR